MSVILTLNQCENATVNASKLGKLSYSQNFKMIFKAIKNMTLKCTISWLLLKCFISKTYELPYNLQTFPEVSV